ncbi:hypothetical protein [Streptomyces sp. NPDC090029]|uniref:hypothetical protein n=1 Tax=Streptomyces sp. NPDC090029 TaxID=3365924 RepID=UPI0037F5C6CF
MPTPIPGALMDPRSTPWRDPTMWAVGILGVRSVVADFHQMSYGCGVSVLTVK